MTEYGVVPEGFRRKPIEIIDAELRARIAGTVSETLILAPVEPLGAMHAGLLDALDQLWGIAEQSYHGIDPSRAVGAQVVALGKLVSRYRKGARKGSVNMDLVNTWANGSTISPGSILVCVDGNSANSWTNRDTIVKTGAVTSGGAIVPSTTSAVFESTNVGSNARALAGQISKLAASFDGIVSVNNPNDATSGRDEETIEDLRQGFFANRSSGTGKEAAIKDAVEKIEGVISAEVRVNRTDSQVNGLPPRSVQVTVWDGVIPQASDAEIFEAIADNLSSGDVCVGSYVTHLQTGAVTSTEIRFNRAVVLEASIEVEVYGPVSASIVREAILAKQPKLSAPLNVATLIAACMGVGCTNVGTTLLIVGGEGSSSGLSPMLGQILLLDSSRIEVTLL